MILHQRWPCSRHTTQVEVERYFVQLGYFLPSYHKVYWLGLQSQVPPGAPANSPAGNMGRLLPGAGAGPWPRLTLVARLDA